MKQWRNVLVNQHVSLQQAIEVLDKGGLRVVLVVDENDVLKGTLTDGDVRRALLKHLSLEIPVIQVMNAQPKVAQKGWRDRQILSTMQKHQVLQLPIVDLDNRVVGLANLHDLLDQHRYDNPVFLMAGGFGTRLRPLTNSCPKPMLKVGDKPILEKILLSFVEAGFYRFYISTHYMPEVIKEYFGTGEKWGVQIQYTHEEKPLGTGGALGLLPHDEIDLPLFVMNGDLLTSLNIHSFLEFHQSQNSVATMCVREYEHQIPYGVVTSEGTAVKAMVEKPVQKFFINAGIYLLDPELVKSVKQDQVIDMPTLLEQQIEHSKLVSMFPIHEYWLDIGRMDDFYKAQQEVEILFND